MIWIVVVVVMEEMWFCVTFVLIRFAAIVLCFIKVKKNGNEYNMMISGCVWHVRRTLKVISFLNENSVFDSTHKMLISWADYAISILDSNS